MAKMIFNTPGCAGATSGVTGRNYNSDRSGAITVTDPADYKAFKDAGYIPIGGMPKFRKFWVCECGWEASINSCPKCGSTELTKVER